MSTIPIQCDRSQRKPIRYFLTTQTSKVIHNAQQPHTSLRAPSTPVQARARTHSPRAAHALEIARNTVRIQFDTQAKLVWCNQMHCNPVQIKHGKKSPAQADPNQSSPVLYKSIEPPSCTDQRNRKSNNNQPLNILDNPSHYMSAARPIHFDARASVPAESLSRPPTQRTF